MIRKISLFVFITALFIHSEAKAQSCPAQMDFNLLRVVMPMTPGTTFEWYDAEGHKLEFRKNSAPLNITNIYYQGVQIGNNLSNSYESTSRDGSKNMTCEYTISTNRTPGTGQPTRLVTLSVSTITGNQ